MSEATSRETLGFQTEVRQLLKLMIHSLYSNPEIFLRELISNASDAADKLRFEALNRPELLGDDPQFRIRVEYDSEARTLTVTDNGIGMSRDELIENLGTIAKSGTTEFLSQMTGDQKQDAKLIGQFGVGFYSAFIVADKVTVESLRAGASADAGVCWESDGEGEFVIEALPRAERGTRVKLHLKQDAAEFCEPLRLETLIRRYSDHIAFPVTLADSEGDEERVVNTATALWTRSRSDIDDDEYREFYKHLVHDFADPLAWSHNRVEGKREYTSLLYIPSAAPFDLWNREAPRGLKLYVQRVFIMDDAEQFLPLYLRFVKGVVDSSDLPLNVSRELLQHNPELDAMRKALTRRALDMLGKLAGGDGERYATFWREFGQVLKEGIVEDQENRGKLAKLLRFATTKTEGEQKRSLDEYLERAQPEQDKVYYLLADNYATAAASPHLEALVGKDIEVLLLTDRIDPWMIESLGEYDGKTLVDVARGDFDLPEGAGALSRDVLNDEHKGLLKKIKRVLKDRIEAVNVSNRLVDSPACVVTGSDAINPQLRRILEASGQQMPDTKPNLEVNMDHPLLRRLSSEPDDARFAALSHIVLDHALLAEGSQLDSPGDYVRRMNNLLLELDSNQTAG